MGIAIAEYFGQRTDVAAPIIAPIPDGAFVQCPFMNFPCMKAHVGNKPFCCVRKNDGLIWISCRNRLCSTKKNVPLTDYQKNILLEVAKTVFSPSITSDKVLIKREVPMHVIGRSHYNADFIMVNDVPLLAPNGPSRVVLEMQGGGETSNTGKITRHIGNWELSSMRSNALLAEPINGVGTIETNAWRRQQEQFLIKGRIAMQTGNGCGIVFCVGPSLYDYLRSRVEHSNLTDLRSHNWTLALIGFKEDTSAPASMGPIPLVIDTARIMFTDYQAFVRVLTDTGRPSPDSFRGIFEKLSGETTTIV